MRLIRIVASVACMGFVASPAFAAQRGPHVAPHVPAASSAPAHPEAATPDRTPGPVPHPITINPALASRLQPLLPSGMSVKTAASGFRTHGQFVAAVHVSHNLGIPFPQLKAALTGTTHESLGQAIQDLRPSVDAKAAVTAAERQEREDLEKTKPGSTTNRDGGQ